MLAVALVACSEREPEDVRAQASSIVGGTPSSANASPVVYVGINGGGGCSGTMVAPNLVLTAKHCVAADAPSYFCDENGSTVPNPDTDAGITVVYPDAGEFGSIHPLEAFFVGRSGQSDLAPRVAQVIVAPGETVCKTDIAFLLLDRPVDDPVVAPIRLDRKPAVGEHLTATGWGLVSGKDPATVLQERAVIVLDVGPMPRRLSDSGPPVGAVPPSFFTVGEGLCSGDSGSPALASSGAVVGVASAIDNPDLGLPSGTARDCVGPNLRGIYAATADQKEFILGAYSAAHATPWLEGEPDPRAGLKDFGSACASDAECTSNACVPGFDGGSQCSHGCLDRACPDRYRCGESNGRARCLPDVPAAAPSVAAPSAGGCDVSSSSPLRTSAGLRMSAVLAVTALLGITIACARRRDRMRRNSSDRT